MLGTNVPMLQPVAFFVGVGENVFGFRRQGQFYRSGNLLAQESSSLDLFADRLDRNLCAREKAARKGLIFTHQAKQEVLRLDGRSSKL